MHMRSCVTNHRRETQRSAYPPPLFASHAHTEGGTYGSIEVESTLILQLELCLRHFQKVGTHF